MKQSIVFRADGSSKMGLGHLFRSAALAKIIRNDFSTVFIIRTAEETLLKNISLSVDKVISLAPDISIDDELATITSELTDQDIVVLDGYHFTGSYQQKLRGRTKASIVCIDDIHQGKYVSDAVINHIGGISINDYQSDISTAFFLGIDYSIVNRVFLEKKTNWDKKNNLLICLGGADPNNDTQKIIAQTPFSRFDLTTVIVGGGYLHNESLKKFTRDKNVSIRQNLQPAEVAQIMSECKYAILSPSTVCYEYMHIGGIVYLYQIADNQKKVKDFFIKNELAFDFSEINEKGKQENVVLEKQRVFFDKRSHERLLKLFTGLSFIKQCKIRRAESIDKIVVFEWANDSLTRSMSFSNEAISYESHLTWYDKKINDPQVDYYIFEKENEPVAQIRFDIKDREAFLSYLIRSDDRGKSLGVWILAQGINQLIQERPGLHMVTGFVKRSNIASCKSFEKLRFKKEDTVVYPDSYKYTIEV